MWRDRTTTTDAAAVTASLTPSALLSICFFLVCRHHTRLPEAKRQERNQNKKYFVYLLIFLTLTRFR